LTIFKQKDLNVEYKRIQPQIQRGMPRQNMDTNTQIMESESAFWVPILKAIGKTKKIEQL